MANFVRRSTRARFSIVQKARTPSSKPVHVVVVFSLLGVRALQVILRQSRFLDRALSELEKKIMGTWSILLSLASIMLILWRIGFLRSRLPRVLLVTLSFWFLDYHVLRFQVLTIPQRFAFLIQENSEFLTIFYHAIKAVGTLLLFVFTWVLDRNISTFLLMRRLNSKHRRDVDKPEAIDPIALIKVEQSKCRTMREFRPRHDGFCLKLGEAADLINGVSTRSFFYLPPRGFYTNTIFFGSVGSGKTAGGIYPLLEQMVSYNPSNKNERIGGLAFDPKEDFTDVLKGFCQKAGRDDDFALIEVGGDYVLNPVYDPDMNGQSIASLLASLVSQILGESKSDPFWKGQYLVITGWAAEGMRMALDYVNLLYIPSMIIGEDSSDSFIQYVQFLLGSDNCNEGQVFVYRNIFPNTEDPYNLYEEENGFVPHPLKHKNVKSFKTRNSQVIDGVATLTKRILELEDSEMESFSESLHADFLKRMLNECNASIAKLTESSADALAILEEERQSITESLQKLNANGIEESKLESIVKAIIDPRNRDKAAVLEKVLEILNIPFQIQNQENPFEGSVNPFSHDEYGCAPNQISFITTEGSLLVRWLLRKANILFLDMTSERVLNGENYVKWFKDQWRMKDIELQSKIFGGPEIIIEFFKPPEIMRSFAPSLATYYDLKYNRDRNRRKLFPPFDEVMSQGLWACVRIPKAKYQITTDVLCTLIKQQLQCVALQRLSPRKRAMFPHFNWERDFCIVIDEMHIFATAGKTQDSDNNFYSLNRQYRVFLLGATQTLENFDVKFGDTKMTKQLLGCIRNKIFLGLESEESAAYASKMVGKGLVYRVSKSMGENQSNTPYSVFAGGYASEEAGVSKSLSYQQQMDEIIPAKEFLELRSFSAIAVCYDGDQRLITRLFLKPYWLDMNEAFYWQVANGKLAQTKSDFEDL